MKIKDRYFGARQNSVRFLEHAFENDIKKAEAREAERQKINLKYQGLSFNDRVKLLIREEATND
jgi:hypothetical protein